MRWDILAGEYPPAAGGVGDYTQLLAGALADAGHAVHVWSARDDTIDHPDARVHVHTLGGGWGRSTLLRLQRDLGEAGPGPQRLLVQYAPRAFGMNGLNLRFCNWVRARARAGHDVRVMFHEPFFPFGWQRPQRNVLAAVNRAMAAALLAAGDPVYVSVPSWESLLRPWTSRHRRFIWLPVPSSIPPVADGAAVASVRMRMSESGRRLVLGHFGTYGTALAPLLRPVLSRVLDTRPDTILLLLGAGGAEFARSLPPSLAPRIIAPGRLPAREVSVHLQACDVALQLYPDGVSSRRTTAMAWLAHGIPLVTTPGRFTEPVWGEAKAVALADGDPAREVGALLDDATARTRLGAAGERLYAARFSFDHVVRKLTSDAASAAAALAGSA